MEILLELNSNVLKGKALCVTKISKFQHFVNTINWKGTLIVTRWLACCRELVSLELAVDRHSLCVSKTLHSQTGSPHMYVSCAEKSKPQGLTTLAMRLPALQAQGHTQPHTHSLPTLLAH